jgi:SAM-dependent methyltransferase
MYSDEWFETFAATVPAEFAQADLQGILSALPLSAYRRLLDVGCGIGRLAGPLAAAGYDVVGLDVNVSALRAARARAPGARYLALDQRDVGALPWRFDGALVLWNSLGFVGRDADLGTLRGLASVLRPGGRVVLDLYHPDWLARHERSGERDERGASVRRWLRGGRLFPEIRYDGGRVDDIQFEVYRPDEMRALCASAGLRVESVLVAWCAATPTGDAPRYQLVACAPEDGR